MSDTTNELTKFRWLTIKLATYAATSDDALRNLIMVACIDAGLLWSPMESLGDDLQKTIQPILDEQKAARS